MRKIEKALSALFLTLLFAVFVHWLFYTASFSIAAILVSAAVCLLFGLLGVNGICAVLSEWNGQIEVDLKSGLGARSLRAAYRHPFFRLAAALILTRLAVFALAYALYTARNGYAGGLTDTLSIWLKGDAPHYLGIAENWYVAEGDPRFHIVFFPLYPICVRILNTLLHNAFASGLLLSGLFTVLAGILLYELALLDMDRAAAKRAVKYLMLLPAAFLFSAPMSDSLFLTLSIACMLCARKKRYAFAGILGGLAAFTRILGVLLFVPMVVEILGDAVRKKRQGGGAWSFLSTRLLCSLLIPMGLLLYLYINYSVTGDAFTFLTYQREHWSQQPGWFFHTAAYQTEYFLDTFGAERSVSLGLWLPNILYIALAPVCLLLAVRIPKASAAAAEDGAGAQKETLRQPYMLRASYIAYFIAYYFVSVGATWLLSAPRYLTCCFPLALALAVKPRSQSVILLRYAALFSLQALYLAAYVAGWPVY